MDTGPSVSRARTDSKVIDHRLVGPGGRYPCQCAPFHAMMSSLSLTGQYLAADRRVRELARIRQVFVPELILRLHTLLVSSRTHIPEYVLISVSSSSAPSSSRIFCSVLLATSGTPCSWRISSRTRGTCCSPSLRGRTDGGSRSISPLYAPLCWRGWSMEGLTRSGLCFEYISLCVT
jgi:Nuclear pore protein 84 / 107